MHQNTWPQICSLPLTSRYNKILIDKDSYLTKLLLPLITAEDS